MRKVIALLLTILLLAGAHSVRADNESVYTKEGETILREVYEYLVEECGAPQITFNSISVEGSLYFNALGDISTNTWFIAFSSSDFTLIFPTKNSQHTISTLDRVRELLGAGDIGITVLSVSYIGNEPIIADFK